MGTATDPYQHCEGRYRLTRGVVEALADFANPMSMLTKSTLIVRDLDVFQRLARVTDVSVAMSVGTLDEDVRRVVEPGTPPGGKRLEILRRFADAGIRTGVLVAPLLPGLTDDEEHIDEVLAACAEAGVSFATRDPAPRAARDPRPLHAVDGAHLPRGSTRATSSCTASVPTCRRSTRSRSPSGSRACGSGTGSAWEPRRVAVTRCQAACARGLSLQALPEAAERADDALAALTLDGHVARPAAGAPADDDDDQPAALQIGLPDHVPTVRAFRHIEAG